MEDASKALMMAASILIGVILLTVFVATISRISNWSDAQDDMKEAEQIAEFNKEYEVYQKSAMYGVDVISCLNKAKSNNEKYVEGDGFTGNYSHSKDREVNVTIELTTPLSETISVTAMQFNNFINGYRESAIYDTSNTVENKFGTNLKLKDVFDIDEEKQLTSFDKNDFFKYEMSRNDSGIQVNKKHQLVDSTISDDNNTVLKILAHSNNPRQIVKNTETLANFVYNPSAQPPSYGWNTATWSTYLYSFKQKRFKCTNLEYSSQTGLVNKIEFIEI